MRLAIAVLVLLAGCVEDKPPLASDEEEAGQGPSPQPSAPSPNAQRPAQDNDTGPVTVETDAGQIFVYHARGYFDPGVATWFWGSGWTMQHNVSLPFPVFANASGMVAELLWDDAFHDIDLHFRGASAPAFPYDTVCATVPVPPSLVECGDEWLREGSPGSPDSPAVMRFVDDIEPHGCTSPPGTFDCRYIAWADAYGLTTRVDFDIYVSVFYGMEPPEGYSAGDAAP
jgi:hypothetical protein